jgi:hypothetical protein
MSTTGVHIYFPKIWQQPKNSRIQQSDMKQQVPHSGCTDIRRHRTELSRLGFLHRWSSIKLTNRPSNVHGSLGHSEGTFISSSPVLFQSVKACYSFKEGKWVLTSYLNYFSHHHHHHLANMQLDHQFTVPVSHV